MIASEDGSETQLLLAVTEIRTNNCKRAHKWGHRQEWGKGLSRYAGVGEREREREREGGDEAEMMTLRRHFIWR